MRVVASGDEQLIRSESGRDRWQIISGPVREFTMIVDDDLSTISREVAGVTVHMHTDGAEPAGEIAEIALEVASESLQYYAESFGAYPFAELDIIDTELAGALGVSWSGLIFINGPDYLRSARVAADPNGLRFTLAHEVGHQWWGASVGVDSNDHTFLLEGLTNYLTVLAMERIDGYEAAAAYFSAQCVAPYLNALRQYGDGVADFPISAERDGPPLGALVYGKAAIGFHAIRLAIGDDQFLEAVAAWADQFAFGIAAPATLLAAFEDAAQSQLDALWSFWFNEARTAADDVAAVPY
jgi:aminopeptidase N